MAKRKHRVGAKQLGFESQFCHFSWLALGKLLHLSVPLFPICKKDMNTFSLWAAVRPAPECVLPVLGVRVFSPLRSTFSLAEHGRRLEKG